MSYSNADYRVQTVHQWADELLEFTNIDPDVALQEALIVQAEIDDELHAHHTQLSMDHSHDYMDIEEMVAHKGEMLAIQKIYDERITSSMLVEELPLTQDLPF